MEVLSAEVLNIERKNENIILTVKMEVTSGSYIRTLAEELGKRLLIPAMLTDLRRTEIGEYSVKDAITL